MNQQQAPAVTRDSPKRFDMAAFAARRFKAILVIGGLLFVLLLPAAFFKSSAYYETSGKILLAREMPQITGRSDEFNIANYFHDYARTQVERIRSAITLEAALESLPEESRKAFMPKGVSAPVAVSRLQRKLSVAQVPNTHVIQIQIMGDEARGLAEMVNAVMDTYLRRLRHEEENKDSRRLEFLTQERDALARDISEWTQRVSGIVQETKTSPDQDQNDIFLHRVMQLQDAYLRAHNEYVLAEKEFRQAQADAEHLRKVPIKVLADDMVAGDQSLWRTSSWTYEKLQELRASIDGIAKGNPDRQYIEKRMEAMQEYEQKQRREVRENAERIVNEKREYEISRRLISAESAFRVKEQAERELRTRLDQGLSELESNSMRVIQGKELLRNIENSKKKFFELESRIRDLQLDAKAPLRISIESYAITPESPAGSNFRKLVMMLLMISLGAVGAAFFIYDFTDPRVRGPKDIQNLMGRPPTWPISAYPTRPGQLGEFASVSLDDPQSREAKAVRSLAVRLNKERTENGSKVAMFTGVHDGCGATSLMLNAAHSMLNFCGKVLVIDGNALRPELISLAGLEPMEGGLDRVLGCNLDLEHCLTRDQRRGLDVLALGRGPWQQEHLRRLPELFGRIKERYDFIFIDAAPVLASDLTEALAVLADVCVLVVQGDRTPYPDLARSVEILLRLEIPGLAIVLNWGGPKPVTRMGALAARLPWPFIANLLARGSRLSGKAMFVLAGAGLSLLTAFFLAGSHAWWLTHAGVAVASRTDDSRQEVPDTAPSTATAAQPGIVEDKPVQGAPLSGAPLAPVADPSAPPSPQDQQAQSPAFEALPPGIAEAAAAQNVDDNKPQEPMESASPQQLGQKAEEKQVSTASAPEPDPRPSPVTTVPPAPPAVIAGLGQGTYLAGQVAQARPSPSAKPKMAVERNMETSISNERTINPEDTGGSDSPGMIRAFEVVQDASGLTVTIRADRPIGRITWFYLADTGRLAFDIRGAWKSAVQGGLPVKGGNLSKARVGIHPDKVRLVLELGKHPGGPTATVESTQEGARIRIGLGEALAGF
jgi:Mrp family chromosome partitioning ATPase/capsular polysaccharide biosynthesis protein